MSSKTSDRIYYDYTPSQEALRLQWLNCVHRQVNQIPFYILINQELDFDLLKKALNIEIARNDCMRLRHKLHKLKMMQYFIPPYEVEDVPFADFTGKTKEEQDAYFRRDAAVPIHYKKGEVFRVVFFRSFDGQSGVYICASHLNMDAMAVTLFFSDLVDIYVALLNGTELPAPLDCFEKGIQSDLAYFKKENKLETDEKFFKQFFAKDGRTVYASPSGLKKIKHNGPKKKSPRFRQMLSFNPIQDKTDNLRFHLSKEKTERLMKFCRDNSVSHNTLICLGLRTYLSKINDCTDDVYFYTVCSRRFKPSDKRSGGCRVQATPLRTVIGKDVPFAEALKHVNKTQFSLYRHADYPFTSIYSLLARLEHRTKLTNTAAMMLSCIPVQFSLPEGWEIDFGGYSTGRFAYHLYLIVVPSLKEGGLDFYFEYRTHEISRRNVTDLFVNTVRVIEAGMANPDMTLGALLDSGLWLLQEEETASEQAQDYSEVWFPREEAAAVQAHDYSDIRLPRVETAALHVQEEFAAAGMSREPDPR